MEKTEYKKPSFYTINKNKALAKQLKIDLQHPQNEELALAKSHCIKSYNGVQIKGNDGRILFDHGDYSFLEQEAVPESINPSLWLNGKGLYEAGVFEVVGRDIIQVRGFDIANISFVRGREGWIVVDTGSTVEGMDAAIHAVEESIGEQLRTKLKHVIISHSHGDHFAGIEAVLASNPDAIIYAPKGFLEATKDEYVFAGKAMSSRAGYQMGAGVDAGKYGKISVGCGLATVAGTASFSPATYEISENKTIEIDGIHVDFQIASETEAVANMQNYFHEYEALWVADNCIGTLHNIYTMRGAKVRDALIWSNVLYETAIKYGKQAKVIFQGHAWPHWNTEEKPDAVLEVLLKHAAIYKTIHDQALAAVAKGVKPDELKNYLSIPEELEKTWYLRPYYGTYETNVRAIFQKYLGFYDGNPVHLNQSTEKEFAKKLIEYIGSKEKLLEKAQVDLQAGNYQIAAEMANYVLQLFPENKLAREIVADSLEQLAYQTESSIWRNGYLKAVGELRSKADTKEQPKDGTSYVLLGLGGEQVLQYIGLSLDFENLPNNNETWYVQIDEKESFVVQLYQGTLLQTKISEEQLPNRQIIKIAKRDLVEAIGSRKENNENSFLDFVAKNTVNLSEYPMHYIAPSI